MAIAETQTVHETHRDTTPRPLSLRRNFSWTLTGNVVYAACQCGMLMALAKLGSPEMVGQFSLGLAITAPIVMLANLNLRAMQATDVRCEFVFGDYLALRLTTATLAIGAIAGVAWWGNYAAETALVIVAIGLAKAVESISDVSYGALQQHERMDRIARLEMIKGPLSLGAMVITLYFTRSVLWSVIALCMAWVLRLFVYDLPSVAWVKGVGSRVLRPRWNGTALMTLTRLSLPLGVLSAIGSLETNIPRYFIEHYLGEAELGFFTAMSYFMVAGRTVTLALAQSALPRLARYYADDQLATFGRLLVKLVGAGVLIGVCGMAVVFVGGRQLLTLLFTAEYAQYTDVFCWLMVAFTVRVVSAFLNISVRAMRRFKIQVPIHLASITLLIVLSQWGTIRYGIQGATWAIVATAVFDCAVYLSVLAVLLRRPAGRQPDARQTDGSTGLREAHAD